MQAAKTGVFYSGRYPYQYVERRASEFAASFFSDGRQHEIVLTTLTANV
jgi:hypothetical protein